MAAADETGERPEMSGQAEAGEPAESGDASSAAGDANAGSTPSEGPARRSTHIEHEVVYAAVGASAGADLMRFPPEGSIPYEEEQRLGSGSDRFLIASSALMTWGAQRGAGIEVAEVVQGDGGEYGGVTFDEHGDPQPAVQREVQYGPEGEPYLTAGTTATLRWGNGREPRRIRVIYTIDETRRVGYGWGTADDVGVVGETAFAVEHRDDDTVWATVRGFAWTPEGGLLNGLKSRSAMRQLIKDLRAQLAALAPGGGADASAAGVADADGADSGGADPEPVADAEPGAESPAAPDPARPEED